MFAVNSNQSNGKGTVVFFHAHPDDEAIFTGATIAHLVDEGWRVVVVVGTRGELGGPESVPPAEIGRMRSAETHEACAVLGAQRVHFLGYSDSGLATGDWDGRVGLDEVGPTFANASTEEVAGKLAEILVVENALALVIYDDGGIYGHPDHLQIHRAGRRATDLAETVVRYEATVDIEYLHYVETHLVAQAHSAMGNPVAAGVPSVLVSTTIAAGKLLDRKRRAMAAHASQIPASSDPLSMDDETFAAVYGFEWFVRSGPRGPIESLAAVF